MERIGPGANTTKSIVDSWQELRFGSKSKMKYGHAGRIPQIIDFPDRQIQQSTSGIAVLCPIMRAQRILEGNFSSQLQGLLCSRKFGGPRFFGPIFRGPGFGISLELISN